MASPASATTGPDTGHEVTPVIPLPWTKPSPDSVQRAPVIAISTPTTMSKPPHGNRPALPPGGPAGAVRRVRPDGPPVARSWAIRQPILGHIFL